ncbi:hypothetical protein M5689_011704 [Euphorbia peplus]|nr:hypothetical protein M5689_011704 [Euphorbia peplus]
MILGFYVHHSYISPLRLICRLPKTPPLYPPNYVPPPSSTIHLRPTSSRFAAVLMIYIFFVELLANITNEPLTLAWEF